MHEKREEDKKRRNDSPVDINEFLCFLYPLSEANTSENCLKYLENICGTKKKTLNRY